MSSHPALSFTARARVRTAPRGGFQHVEIEASELASVVSRVALDELDGLSHAEALAAVTFACGRALRCPVVLRAGANDARGRTAPGNSGAQLLAALAGRSNPYSAEMMRLAVLDGHEKGILARASRIQKGEWQDAKGKKWRSKFLRGLVYVPRSIWERLYHDRAYPQLAAQIGRIMPRSWVAAARLRRHEGGLWGAIRPPPKRPVYVEADVPARTILASLRDGQPWASIVAKHPGLSYARIRAVFAAWKAKFGSLRTKRSQSSRGHASRPTGTGDSEGAKRPPAPKPDHPTLEDGARAAWRGGGVIEAVEVRSPSSRLADLMGADHPLLKVFSR